MITHIHTAALSGIDGLNVHVEVDISRGLPGFHLVGLPNAEVRESRERVLSALRNSGCQIPAGKITVNLAPAGVRKEGASFDLAIAMAILNAATRIHPDEDSRRRSGALFLGELSLFGDLRPVRGLLAMVLAGAESGGRLVVVPSCQQWEARLVPGVEVVAAANLKEVVSWWVQGQTPSGGQFSEAREVIAEPDSPCQAQSLTILNHSLAGMPLLHKAALVAAVGRHNLLMTGSPGSGKTRLARLLGDLQAPLTTGEALEVTRIHSAAGTLSESGMMRRRPLRAPHHSITRAGLLGGGAGLRPGEVTLAHGGLLFLDELAEFAPGVLDVLREPMEQGRVDIVRGPGRRSYPARFQLVAAMNPCRCGYLGSGIRKCRCDNRDRSRYLSRLAGPLLDRFDLFVEVSRWEGDFLGRSPGESLGVTHSHWRDNPDLGHLNRAREILLQGGRPTPRQLDSAAARYLNRMRQPLGLSLRGVHRCIQVAGTLAVLDGGSQITKAHLVEALEFRHQPGDLPGQMNTSG